MRPLLERWRRAPGLRLFPVEEMPWTMFTPTDDNHPALLAAGIALARRAEDADILVASRLEALIPYGHLAKTFAIWTHEPRYNMAQASVVETPAIGRPVHVMNCHTGTLNTDPLGFAPSVPLDRDAAIRGFRDKPRRTVMLATYRANAEFFVGGRDISLVGIRNAIAIAFQRRDACDVWGRRWPDTVRVAGETRGGEWIGRKMAVLRDYSVNIAYENSHIRYYITEKIWQAVEGGCLPVYYGGGNGIYEIFARDSFVEGEELLPEALHARLAGLGVAERTERYAACVDAYNLAARRYADERPDLALVGRTVRFLKAASAGQAAS